jgi:protein-S-isoprenylcysteine O-methyltransferase Ste14
MNAEGGRWLWQVEGTPALLLTLIRYAGGLGLLISLLQIDSLRFIGWRQFVAFLKGQPLPLAEEPFVMWGVYALVRHPLYFFSLIFLWVTPSMSAASFGFALGATLYFALGSLLEERKLLAVYGETYRAYRQRVAWLVPFVKLPTLLRPLQRDGGY